MKTEEKFCRLANCIYYNSEVKTRCSVPEECKDKSKYKTIFSKTDCVYYREGARMQLRCKILKCKDTSGAPCEAPRIKSDGTPHQCTFFKRRSEEDGDQNDSN